jgi:RNA polymerase sigma-70 factor, ECF subfamily
MASEQFGRELIALLPRLRRYALSLAGRASAADDLVQTACERALAAASSYAPGTRFDAWVFRILRNAWIDGLRRSRREGPSEDVSALVELAGSDGVAETEHRLMLRRVGEAIGRLPVEQREIVLLVCAEGLSYAEAAALLDVPIGTVMSRLARARAKLAEETGID